MRSPRVDPTLGQLDRDLLYRLRAHHNTWPELDQLTGEVYGVAANARERTRVIASLAALQRLGYVSTWRDLGRPLRYTLTTNGETLVARLDQLTLA